MQTDSVRLSGLQQKHALSSLALMLVQRKLGGERAPRLAMRLMLECLCDPRDLVIVTADGAWSVSLQTGYRKASRRHCSITAAELCETLRGTSKVSWCCWGRMRRTDQGAGYIVSFGSIDDDPFSGPTRPFIGTRSEERARAFAVGSARDDDLTSNAWWGMSRTQRCVVDPVYADLSSRLPPYHAMELHGALMPDHSLFYKAHGKVFFQAGALAVSDDGGWAVFAGSMVEDFDPCGIYANFIDLESGVITHRLHVGFIPHSTRVPIAMISGDVVVMVEQSYRYFYLVGTKVSGRWHPPLTLRKGLQLEEVFSVRLHEGYPMGLDAQGSLIAVLHRFGVSVIDFKAFARREAYVDFQSPSIHGAFQQAALSSTCVITTNCTDVEIWSSVSPYDKLMQISASSLDILEIFAHPRSGDLKLANLMGKSRTCARRDLEETPPWPNDADKATVIRADEAAAIVRRQWESMIETSNPGASGSQSQVVVLEFNKDPRAFDEALLASPPARRAEELGVETKPAWANGAKVFVLGVGPSEMDEAHVELLPRHVVVYESDQQEVMDALLVLHSKVRPRLKPPATPAHVPVAGDESLLCDLSVDSNPASLSSTALTDQSSQSDTQSLGKDEALESILVVRKTFLHLRLREAPSPRTANTW